MQEEVGGVLTMAMVVFDAGAKGVILIDCFEFRMGESDYGRKRSG